jgi:hypothetical protein
MPIEILSCWASVGPPAFLYEAYERTVPLCMFDHILEDRSINSHIQAAFDAVERYGQTSEALLYYVVYNVMYYYMTAVHCTACSYAVHSCIQLCTVDAVVVATSGHFFNLLLFLPGPTPRTPRTLGAKRCSSASRRPAQAVDRARADSSHTALHQNFPSAAN